MKIDSCLIVRNEERNIENVINQLLQFSSHIYLVDTGSVDSTTDVINKFVASKDNVHLHHYIWKNNFADARNYSISLTEDADYIFYCDADEVLSEKFIDMLIEFSKIEYNDNMPDVYSYGVKTKNSFLDSVSDLHIRNGLFKSKFHSDLHFRGTINEYLDTDGHSINTIKFDGHMATNYVEKTADSRFMSLRCFIEEQNEKDKISNRDLFMFAKELESSGMMYHAYLTFVECIYSDSIEYNADALLHCAKLYNKYKICRSVNCVTFSDLVDKMFEKNLFNNSVLRFFALAGLNHGKYEDAKKCALKAYNMFANNCNLMNLEEEYSLKQNLFDLVLLLDKTKDYRSANMYNNLILENFPNDESAKYNKEYFGSILKN